MRATALSQALDLARSPRLTAHMRRQPLPQDIVTVIRLAAGCRETLAAAAAMTKRDRDFIRAAAELYLRQVVCFPEADPYRVLGASTRMPRAEIRTQMRELMLWLHPDRNPRSGDRVLARRVLDAWQVVSDGRPIGPTPVRHRRHQTYRPAWIPRPVRKARSPREFGMRWRFALRLAIIAAGLMAPCIVSLDLSGLAEGWVYDRYEGIGGNGIAGPGLEPVASGPVHVRRTISERARELAT